MPSKGLLVFLGVAASLAGIIAAIASRKPDEAAPPPTPPPLFDPWWYATRITGGGGTLDIIDEDSRLRALADAQAGKITQDQYQQVAALFGQIKWLSP